ncbi:MAG TPA: amino acid permease [Bacteroides sp.]|nr:amino acid permease [Bacteroides sp.]
MAKSQKKGFGTLPVFLTAISTILGAILFLRFGFAVGTLGFWGVILIIILGHTVTIPTALALSELATNRRVEGGGEYFIISRSFGLNIGATIGISLFFSQAISVAFYVIAFTEAFEPIFNMLINDYDINLPRQAVSLPAMALLTFMIIKRGAGSGVKVLYIVVGILIVAIACFFLGTTDYVSPTRILNIGEGGYEFSGFFLVFAIIFPAFTGMTAGVGLSGDLRNPGKSIPLGTTLATVSGAILYVFIAWKLFMSASPEQLIGEQLVMSRIALYGGIVIPLGLAASTISSAIGSVMVAPRTMQALGRDRSFPLPRFNRWLSRGKGESGEPVNASILTCAIAFIFVALGDVNVVASIISMFFMVTYGALCLISFLFHFGADPSYRPVFRSRWYISLLGFVMSFWLMFKISAPYALLAIAALVLLYLIMSYVHKERRGLQAIFSNAIFQLSRNIQIYLQKRRFVSNKVNWRPSIICISDSTFKRGNSMRLLNWLSYRYGFGTYIHFINDYFSKNTREVADEAMEKLLALSSDKSNHIYVDTIISPSYTSAIAQVVQIPGISGMDNNGMLLEFDKADPSNLNQIIENVSLVAAARYDIGILGSSSREFIPKKGIHIWIRHIDYYNANLMILLGYIILSHPDLRKSKLKIFEVSQEEDVEATRKKLLELIQAGRLPISERNIEILNPNGGTDIKSLVNEHSADAALCIVGFKLEQLKHDGEQVFLGYENTGDTLFVNARELQKIS